MENNLSKAQEGFTHYTPEVGEKCEARWLELPDGGDCEWKKVVYRGFYEEQHWFGGDSFSAVMHDDHCEFRPLRTQEAVEREELLEDIVNFYDYPKGAEEYLGLAKYLISKGYYKNKH